MRILITTGLSRADIGGPTQYGSGLKNAFQELGHEAKLISYGRTEKFLPIGARHIFFFFRILPQIFWANYVLTLDTFSTGVPSVWGAKILGKRNIVRVGGDYLWSAYVNRTGKSLILPDFYDKIPKLSLKEKLVAFLMRQMIKRADFLAFNTEWQREIWQKRYDISYPKSNVVRNYIPEKKDGEISTIKNFLWAGRVIPEKNLELLKMVGERVAKKYPEFRLDILTGKSHEQVLDRIKDCYAAISVAFADFCPNFIIEAVSFNKPFIISKETGLNEIYPEGGLFFDPHRPDELERSMEAALDYRIYNKLVEELKENAISHSWKNIAEEYLDIWKRI
ncbi:MAG: Glycosyl transferase, group 1 [Parcubacteria group bacterium GW2011_GWD1_44_9]|nr:MAG: Glycosyl transferase, group 1 [Parcubacteria group bacterium GW2011_GWC1_43_30]KKT84692.1 MAG: Glycosyl transferase, group 1 [Parcubacteria group bacterium GW2011_GWD1_44_9]